MIFVLLVKFFYYRGAITLDIFQGVILGVTLILTIQTIQTINGFVLQLFKHFGMNFTLDEFLFFMAWKHISDFKFKGLLKILGVKI